jgi:glycerol uptake facilitator-like aquaporin
MMVSTRDVRRISRVFRAARAGLIPVIFDLPEYLSAAVALLANTIATGAALLALILTFGSISGAHFNPAVTLADAMERGVPWREVPFYIAAQCTGGIAGTVVAHLMFGLPLWSLASRPRSGRLWYSVNSSQPSGSCW